jgi:hypothetical protein
MPVKWMRIVPLLNALRPGDPPIGGRRKDPRDNEKLGGTFSRGQRLGSSLSKKFPRER